MSAPIPLAEADVRGVRLIATGLVHDGLEVVLIPGDGLFTVREVA
jgi:hypothetical protein